MPKVKSQKSVIAEGVGVATRGRKGMSTQIEQAMSAAILQIQKESEALWARPDLSQEEKTKQIAAINTDEAKRARMMAAREAVKSAAREETEAKAKAAQEQKG